MTAGISAEIFARIDALQFKYVRALDRFDMAGWLDCFPPHAGSYVCTTRENEEQNLPLALMMDDSRARLQDRVKFITEVWAGTFEEYSTRHFVQRLVVQRLDCTETGDGRFAVESNFMVAYTSDRRHSEILTAGIYLDEVSIRSDGGSEVAWFETKRAILDTVTTPRYLVYPV